MSATRRHSIRGKLTRIIMVTSSTAVLLACLGFVVSDLMSVRDRLQADLSTLADVVGSNSTAALAFGDGKAAQDALDALRAKPSIVAAAIYTAEGALFARYQPVVSVPPVPLRDGFHIRPDRVEFFYAIRLDQERIGTLYIASDASDHKDRMRQYAVIAVAIVLVSLLTAFALSATLQRSISEPIVELARVARLVSQDKNFSIRASSKGSGESDEIRNLMTGFNVMLAEIGQRDDRLLKHQVHLEEMVALRTAELTTANEELLAAKNAAEKAAEVNAQLARQSALILNSATDGIFGMDLDSEPSFINPAASRMLGRTLAELQGKSLHGLMHHSAADGTPMPEDECPLGAALDRGEALTVADDTFWRADGTCFPVEYSATPILDEEGRKLGAVLLFRDVTERKAIERLKSEFVSTVSHELRTPLTSIRGALGLLGSGLLGPIGERGQRMLDIAVTNTDRLVRLINDILDLERIESGKVELVRGPVDALSVMTQTLEGLQSMADQARVTVVVEPAEATLWGDADRIIQTLTNLLGNAIKFSPPETTVIVSGTTRNGEFVFCVTDEGRGVPEGKLGTIFGRFSQVDASDSRDRGGSGLGLAISQSIVHAHGGRIWAEKNDPVGSRFQFTIPLAAVAELAIVAGEEGHGSNGSTSAGAIVLVVEDDLDLARVLIASLQRRGIRTFHAITGAEAIQCCQEHDPNLIVLDLGLPDMDGFAVIQSLRMVSTVARTPVVVYSASDVGAADQARLRLGPTEFLTKSRCSPADFEAHVVHLLEITRAGKGGENAA